MYTPCSITSHSFIKNIALLRGINVGGKRKIPMTGLRTVFEKLGYTDVESYIQSGNIVYKSPANKKPVDSAQRIQEHIREQYGHEVPVMILPAADILTAVDQNPFPQSNPEDIKKLHLTFLSGTPELEKVEALTKMDFKQDQFVLFGKMVFIRCEGKYHESKLTNNFFERKLEVQATTRNWRTVLKLAEMAAQ